VQGGIITTNDDNLAEIFRNIRSSYGARKVLKVKATCNGRFSEIQAGIGLNILKKCI
jgi:dTDP-4-amino-4,6-dideoxygalactose transaminase